MGKYWKNAIFTVGCVIGYVGRHRGPVPTLAGPAAAAQPRARADAVSADRETPGAGRGRAHAAADAVAAAHSSARARSAAWHHAHEGTQLTTPDKSLSTIDNA